jgi:hypothetical protein
MARTSPVVGNVGADPELALLAPYNAIVAATVTAFANNVARDETAFLRIGEQTGQARHDFADNHS